MLFDHGNKGARWCRDEIARVTGISRSVEATERHANRIGAPMVVYEVCPVCGRATRVMPYKGMCRACNYERLYKEQAAFATQIKAEILKGGESDAERVNRRKYNALRGQNGRACKEHGLPTYRETKCVHLADLSEEMSEPRSEARF
ncbi:MAG: hypothetical protein HFJ75_07560 [Eggerthellaceae bacterium]|nr:hypothetical protein [Eggerthellaceae bacterium]